MATLPVDRPVTPLRQRMLDDMAMRSMRARTQHDYIRYVRAFAAFLGRSPDTATAEDVRRFQLHQRQHGVGESVIGAAVSALRFLFDVTLDRPDLSRRLVLAPRPRKLPDVLSVNLEQCSMSKGWLTRTKAVAYCIVAAAILIALYSNHERPASISAANGTYFNVCCEPVRIVDGSAYMACNS